MTISAYYRENLRAMADKKGWGTTVLGWFVVQEGQAAGDAAPDATPDEPAPAPEPSTFFVSPPPAAPSGLSATAVSSSQINLSWTDNSSDETGFKLERKTGAGGTWSR